jgi:hypothetical protein
MKRVYFTTADSPGVRVTMPPKFISNQDSNHSDIDVFGIHPTLEGDRRVSL